jgi:hypothetical protein
MDGEAAAALLTWSVFAAIACMLLGTCYNNPFVLDDKRAVEHNPEASVLKRGI